MSKKIKKLILIIGIIFFLSGIIVQAGIKDSAERLVLSLGGFEERYDKNPKVWDFILFAGLINIIAYLALWKAFPENKVATYLLSAVIGALFGIAAVKGGMSAKFFIPFVENIFFIFVGGIIFYVLGYVFNLNKAIAFVLAIVITFVLFNVVGLFDDVDASGLLQGLKGNPDLIDIERELITIANRHNIDLSQSLELVDKINLLEQELAKINAKPGSAKLAQLVADKNRLGFLKIRAITLHDKLKLEQAAILESSLAPYKDSLDTITKTSDPIERLKLINELIEEIDKRLIELNKPKSAIENPDKLAQSKPETTEQPDTATSSLPTRDLSINLNTPVREAIG